jgi:hypothetical protein
MSNEKQEKDVWQPPVLAWSELPLGGGLIGRDPEGREWVRVWDPERGRDGLSVTQWQFKNLYRKAVRRGVQAASDLEEHAAAMRKLLESDHPERATALDMNRLNYAHQRMAESMAALDALDELAMGGTDDIDLRAALAREPKSAQAVVNVVRQHTGLMAHDGFAEHSHEVRPDHDGVRRTGKS